MYHNRLRVSTSARERALTILCWARVSFNPHSSRVVTMRLLHLSPPPPWTNIFNLNWNFTIGIKFLKNYPRFLPYSFNLVLIVDGICRSANLQISLRTEVEVKDFRVDLTIFEKKLQRISHPFCSGPQVSSFCVHISGCCRNPCPVSIRFEQACILRIDSILCISSMRFPPLIPLL